MKISTIIFGAGEGARKFLNHQSSEWDIIAVVDNDLSKHGLSFEAFTVSPPSIIETLDYDQIIIATQWAKEVQEQLIHLLHVNPDKIKIPPKSMLKKVQKPFEHEPTRELARSIIKHLSNSAYQHNIPLLVDFGTLLGLVRDNDVIAWDDDVDFSIPFLPQDDTILKWLERTVLAMELPVKLSIHSKLQDTTPFNYSLDFYDDMKALETFEPFITSISFRHIKDDHSIHLPSGGMWYAPKKHFETYEILKWKDCAIQVPSSYEAYLTFLYGDWKTPKKNITMADYAHLGAVDFQELKEQQFYYQDILKAK